MGRSALPNTDRSITWLAELIAATEVVATSAQPCDPAIVKAFSHRLEMRPDESATTAAEFKALPRPALA